MLGEASAEVARLEAAMTAREREVEALTAAGSTLEGKLTVLISPLYFYLQGLIVAGLTIHAHELTHRHIKNTSLNDAVGIVLQLRKS